MNKEVLTSFDEIVEHYDFEKRDDSVFFKRRNSNTWLVIERNDNEEEATYDFYKVSKYRSGQVAQKDFDKGVIEFFLVLRVKKYFAFLKELEYKKKLEPYGGSEHKYREYLKQQLQTAEKEGNEIAEYWVMFANGLELHDATGRRKHSDNQMKMNF